MFFLFGVKGGLLFLITKKEKSPLKLRCSLNNKNALGQALLAKGTLNPSRFKKALNPKTTTTRRLCRQNVPRSLHEGGA
jgi:hypothetical protein